MRNKSGKPFAIKELDKVTGYWNIYLDPSPKLDAGGYYVYEYLTGPIDYENAELIVDLLNEHHERTSGEKEE